MGKTTVSRRGVKGGKRADTNQMREWLSKGNQVTCLGVVRQFPGQDSHFEMSTENGSLEVLVDVELMPQRTRVLCRLGFGNDCFYKIPRVDQEVAVLCPYDPQSLIKDPMDFEPIIVGVLDVSAPSELTGDGDAVIKTTSKITLDSPIVYCGQETGAEPAIMGQTYTNSENTLITALNTWMIAFVAYTGVIQPIADPSGTGTSTMVSATTTLETAILAWQTTLTNYLAQRAKVA